MKKEDLFYKLEQFPSECRGLHPMGLRLEPISNYGLDRHMWEIWIVGERNIDLSLVMWLPDMVFVKRYTSLQRAEKDLIKFRRWFSQWKNENS